MGFDAPSCLPLHVPPTSSVSGRIAAAFLAGKRRRRALLAWCCRWCSLQSVGGRERHRITGVCVYALRVSEEEREDGRAEEGSKRPSAFFRSPLSRSRSPLSLTLLFPRPRPRKMPFSLAPTLSATAARMASASGPVALLRRAASGRAGLAAPLRSARPMVRSAVPARGLAVRASMVRGGVCVRGVLAHTLQWTGVRLHGEGAGAVSLQARDLPPLPTSHFSIHPLTGRRRPRQERQAQGHHLQQDLLPGMRGREKEKGKQRETAPDLRCC